jgi:ribosomal protein L29
MFMSDPRPEMAADLRKLPLEERMRRAREILARVRARGPDPHVRGKSMEEIVQMVKRTREEMAKERLAARS